jgi:hypothetical protein
MALALREGAHRHEKQSALGKAEGLARLAFRSWMEELAIDPIGDDPDSLRPGPEARGQIRQGLAHRDDARRSGEHPPDLWSP